MRLGAVVFISLVISTAERRSIWLDLVSVIQNGHCKMHQEAMKIHEIIGTERFQLQVGHEHEFGGRRALDMMFWRTCAQASSARDLEWGRCLFGWKVPEKIGELGTLRSRRGSSGICLIFCLSRIIEMIVQNLTDQALLAHSWWSDVWFFPSNVSPVIGHPWRRQSCRPSMAGEERVENLWLGDVDSN